MGSVIASNVNALRNSEPTIVDDNVYVCARAEVLAYVRARKTEVAEILMAAKDLACEDLSIPFNLL